MNKNQDTIRKEIECLSRLNSINSGMNDILEFLLSDKLITKEDIKSIAASSDRSRMTQTLLTRLSSEDKLQLLEFNWILLPIERINIIIVTKQTHKEFSYNF